MTQPPAPQHGGRLRRAAAEYALPLEGWLDLSTGVNPRHYPQLADLSPALWQRLPEEEDGLAALAAQHYGAPHALPLAGSQAAIQILPLLRPTARVGIVTPGYAEHRHAWDRRGHSVVALAPEPRAIEAALERLDVLLVINPNNPTGHHFLPETLLTWHARLATRGGWLIVDEAFLDATPTLSLAPYTARAGLMVLRSLGKFYGLAGARVGFLLAAPECLAQAAYELGPWCLAGPAREVARRALDDSAWQHANREWLMRARARLVRSLTHNGLTPAGHCALFAWVPHPQAARLHRALAQRAILTRLYTTPSGLRFGLPGAEAEWQRLDQALAHVTQGGGVCA